MRRDGAVWSELDLQRFLSGFADSRLARIAQYCLALRQQGAIPHRSAIDPSRFKDSLDMVWLLERHQDGHFRYRLAGQTITEIHGGVRRGTNPAALFSPEAFDMFRLRWEAALDDKLVRAEGIVRLSDGVETSKLERLMLPLRGDDGSVSVVLGATNYERPRGPGLTSTVFPPTDVQYCPLIELPPDSTG